MTDRSHSADVLVIGSGIAGLSLALRLAPHARIAVVTKGPLKEGATFYAQGGISAVLDKSDSIASHIEDTLNTGAGLCNPDIVRFTVERGRECIQWLVDQGVAFTRETRADGTNDYHLTQEGGHSHRRVIHAADATGRAVETTLEQLVRRHPNITLFEQHIAVDLITAAKLGRAPQRCLGAYVLNRGSGHVEAFSARCVVLATGGAGKVYLYTSNPDVATGDGIAMAWRAGCRVANMEFVQFHPTCLYHPKAKSFLITEAVRGEGGRLLLPDGTPFMHKFDPRGELAPRDIVARAIDHEMKRLGAPCVYLDISHQPAEFIRSHFPTVYARCLEFGFDMTKEPLPVVPAAHYTCGGVMTDRYGHSDIAGLYAVGEVAHTGLHGANRMASNSLLECVVFAASASRDIEQHLAQAPLPGELPPWDDSRVTDSDEEVVVAHNWDELRRFMWDYVGIVRTTKRLQRAQRRVDLLLHEISEYYANFRVTNDLIELRNLALVADLILRSALARKESRGLHYTLDHPQPDQSRPPADTILVPEAYEVRPEAAHAGA
ncbi:MAG: L-aspartate oxidase [Gammaproteobacteria bacterium]|nr:L-aspartate oxidase [Gammaproteobacteria bacterium]